MPRPKSGGAAFLVSALFLTPGLLAAQTPYPNPFADSITAAARRALDSGRPWQATRLLAPLTRDPASTPPTAAVTAAMAAEQWEGWGTIVRLLFQRPWLESDSTGNGHAALGRALVERGEAPLALRYTRPAVGLAAPDQRGPRLITHARALDRAGLLDSAGPAYHAAANTLPVLADWLRLRAAGVLRDSSHRARLYAEIESPVARTRIAWTEALARERTGDSVGAARHYQALGARLASARLRLGLGPEARQRARLDLLAMLSPGQPPEETAEAIGLLDRNAPARSAADELRIARRAAAIGLLERSARGFAAAGVRLTDRDRFTYATVLSRLGRFEQALPLFDAVKARELQGDAAYQRARMLIRNGQQTRALTALREIPQRFPADSEPAASALFLLADLHADRGADASARRLFLEASRRYPTTPFGQRAGLQAALIAWLDGDFSTAEDEFDRISTTAGHSEAIAAGYWAARAVERLGDTAGSTRRLTTVIGRGRDGYYAVRASARLGMALASPGIESAATTDSLPAALDRARRLAALGLRTEAKFELDAVIASAGSTPERLLAVSRQLALGNWHAQALRLGQRAQAAGAPWTRALAELLYPLPFRDLLLTSTARSRASPSLVAGVIRQESLFDPSARSVADARGLMQVVPAVGASYARTIGIDWDSGLLYQPDLNIDIGVRHLDEGLEQLDWPVRALAAYNGGVDRVRRWQSIRGVRDDPEVFVERIPFSETRDYVRKVLANEAMYAALYPTIRQ